MPPIFSRLVARALDVLFPPSCRGCGQDGIWLCQTCLKHIKPLTIAAPIKGIDELKCLGSYDIPILSRSVQELKYSGGQVLGPPLARCLIAAFGTAHTADVIVPVPLHPSRRRERGFNQSEILARKISVELNIPLRHLVARVRQTLPQVTLRESERLLNVKQAFALAPRLERIPKNGIIVDDVFTTGATIAEVAQVLRQAGMQHVTALTIAKG